MFPVRISLIPWQAVAKADIETVRLGVQQVGLLGHEAARTLVRPAARITRHCVLCREVQSLLCTRDQGDSLLHLAAAGSRQSTSWLTVVF